MTHMASWLQFESHLANGDIVKGPVRLGIKHRENHRCVGGWLGRTLLPGVEGSHVSNEGMYSDLEKGMVVGGRGQRGRMVQRG